MSRRDARPFDALHVPLDDGVTLIEASAGTGKTFAITRLVLRLLLEQRVASLSEILVVTFTEKATQELVTRIRRMLREADLVWSDAPPTRTKLNEDLFLLQETHRDGGAIIRTALGSLDDLGVSTIHGFCQRVLSESALETQSPFRTTFVEDDTEPLLRAGLDWARRRLLVNADTAGQFVAGDGDIGAMVSSFARRSRRQPDTRIDFDPLHAAQALVADFVDSVNLTFDREKERRHLLGFDDLLRKLSAVLVNEGPDGPLAQRIRSRYRAALIDEFQDTDNTQFPIFSNAFRGCPLFLIGDPKQSIYGFRGADINAYLAAADAAAQRYTLTRNFRSTPDCVAAVQELFTRASQPFLYDEDRIDFPRVEAASHPEPQGKLASDGCGAMVWWWVDKSLGKKGDFVDKQTAQETIRRATVNEIVRLIDDGLPPRCVAVLSRTNSAAQRMKDALDAAGVPAVIGGADDVLSTDEAAELVRLSAAIASPYDHRTVSAALATRIWGFTAERIATSVSDGGEAELSRLTSQFAEFREIWRLRGVSAALGALLAERSATERLLTLPDGERRLTNIRHVIELLHEASADEGVVAESVGEWVARELSVQNTPERRMQRLETDSEAVQILTMHKAKGLEFDVVFCPALYDDNPLRGGPFKLTAVSARDGDRHVMDIGSAEHSVRADAMKREEDAEALRLVYVALTRAVHRCYIAFGDIGERDAASRSALGYLLRPLQQGATMRDSIEVMVAGSEGRMTLRELTADAPRLTATVTEQPALEYAPRPLTLAPSQLDTWRLSSFTGLVADAPEGVTRDVADKPVLPDGAGVATGFRAFPAGTQAGIALHDIFERLDFDGTDDPRTVVMVERSLASHGLTGSAEAAPQRRDDVLLMLQRTCAAVVPVAGFALRDIPRAHTLREWRFDLSVGSTSPRRIADVLAAHGSVHAKAYAPALRALRDSAMPGYLGGVLDLAFPRDGRWWIVDWKSNQLGAADARYAPEVLGDVMMEAHYTLQYHLYLLAVHRFLRTRVADYDPATHWGGVAYAFLRGIGDDDPARGWFIDRPSAALLHALDDAVGRRA